MGFEVTNTTCNATNTIWEIINSGRCTRMRNPLESQVHGYLESCIVDLNKRVHQITASITIQGYHMFIPPIGDKEWPKALGVLKFPLTVLNNNCPGLTDTCSSSVIVNVPESEKSKIIEAFKQYVACFKPNFVLPSWETSVLVSAAVLVACVALSVFVVRCGCTPRPVPATPPAVPAVPVVPILVGAQPQELRIPINESPFRAAQEILEMGRQ